AFTFSFLQIPALHPVHHLHRSVDEVPVGLRVRRGPGEVTARRAGAAASIRDGLLGAEAPLYPHRIVSGVCISGMNAGACCGGARTLCSEVWTAASYFATIDCS